MAAKNRGQEIARRPAHIHNSLQPGEVVCDGHSRGLGPVESYHRLAEHRRFFGVLRQPVEYWHAQRLLESAFPGLNRIQQVFKAANPPVACDGQNSSTRRTWCSGFECLTKWRQSEAVRCILGHNPEARERSQKAVQGGRMGFGWSRQFVGALRPLREVISQTQFGGNISDMGYPM